jgi:hypothetical protein
MRTNFDEEKRIYLVLDYAAEGVFFINVCRKHKIIDFLRAGQQNMFIRLQMF